MRACGVIVEYNPFHNGHLYHLQQSKYHSGADCLIAIMSGPFLQRGEPAIIDKWHRAEAALKNGADLVLELPYLYAVEHSDYFSKGAVRILSEIGADSICFGSEHGSIDAFKEAYTHLQGQEATYEEVLRKQLRAGDSFPEAARKGYEAIHFPEGAIDLTQPNNILGYSYVKQILAYRSKITPMTIQRTSSQYHDESINGSIASATSIRKEIKTADRITPKAYGSLPEETVHVLHAYKENNGLWHDWEDYFPLLYYKILTLSEKELRSIHGVDEGLEHRLKRTIKQAATFQEFMEALKTKRYTWTRLQRTLVHILAGTNKQTALELLQEEQPPYARVLGMRDCGQKYLKFRKKSMGIPLLTQPQQFRHPMLDLEERAAISYYSVLDGPSRVRQMNREFGPPIKV